MCASVCRQTCAEGKRSRLFFPHIKKKRKLNCSCSALREHSEQINYLFT